MSYRAVKHVCGISRPIGTRPLGLMLLYVLANRYHDEVERCKAPIASLARDMRCSEATVKKYLKILVELNLITITQIRTQSDSGKWVRGLDQYNFVGLGQEVTA